MRNQLNKNSCVLLLTLGLAALINIKGVAQTTTNESDSIEVSKTMTDFLQAFSNLQWNNFTHFFSDDATAFFPPSAKYPFRANNKEELEKIFKPFFEKVKKQKSAPPYLEIIPKDLKIQTFSSFAIVSFMLDDPGLFGRRTFVLHKQQGKWLIVHLHASGVALESKSAAR